MARPQKSSNEITKAEGLANMARAQSDFSYFVREICEATPYPYQEAVLRDICSPDVHRVVWHKAHGVGGTTTMAWVTLAFLFTRPDSRVITTASVFRQVRDILWPEIHHWMRGVSKNLYRIGWHWPYTLLDQQLKITDSWFALGASSDVPENMEGQHAPHMLYIVDEAKTVERGIFEAIEGALTGIKEAKILVVSTPPYSREGHFYELCSGRVRGWTVHHTKAIDSPNVSPKWVEDRKEEWGENSPVYISKVLGEFPDSSENTLIPLSWIEAAEDRWKKRFPEGEDHFRSIGVDVARYGDDETVLAHCLGNRILKLEIHTKEDTMQTAGRVMSASYSFKPHKVNIDVIGVGAGVYDRTKEVTKLENIAMRVVPINVAAKAPFMRLKGEKILFRRFRDYLYWNLRNHLDVANTPEDELLDLPPDPKLRSQLSALQYTITSDGKIEIESKDDFKKRGYSSPDRAEAVMMAIARGYEGWATTIR